MSSLNCRPAAFKQAFFERYVLPESTTKARQQCSALTQGCLDVLAFNDKFNAALQIIPMVPGGMPMDGFTAVSQFMKVIKLSLVKHMMHSGLLHMCLIWRVS